MGLDEKIREIQSQLVKTLTEKDLESSIGIEKLVKIGIDADTATDLVNAYQNAEKTKSVAKDIWESTLNSKIGSAEIGNIAESQQKELEARQYFDKATFKCALLIAAKMQNPNQIDEEILLKLYQNGIREKQIINPALKITYHYYCENIKKDAERKEREETIRRLSKNLGDSVTSIRELEKQNQILTYRNQDLQRKFSNRIMQADKSYQQALSIIRELTDGMNMSNNRGIFQKIKDKISGKNMPRRLNRAVTNLPKNIYESNAEKIGVSLNSKEILITPSKNEPRLISDNPKNKEEEPQR